MTETTTRRLFIAIPTATVEVATFVRAQRKAIMAALPEHVELRVEPMPHITLRFLGDVDHTEVDEVASKLQFAAGLNRPFQLNLYRMGIFDHSHVIYAGIGGDVDALHTLQREVDAILRVQGFPASELPFHPHLTIGRVHGVMTDEAFASLRDWTRQQEVHSGSSEVVDFMLYESVRTEDGPAYTVAERMLLHGGNPNKKVLLENVQVFVDGEVRTFFPAYYESEGDCLKAARHLGREMKAQGRDVSLTVRWNDVRNNFAI